MPLTRAPGVVKVDLNENCFPDERRGQWGYSGVQGIGRCVAKAKWWRFFNQFPRGNEQHREAVEDLASHKYDLGHASPHVRGSDA